MFGQAQSSSMNGTTPSKYGGINHKYTPSFQQTQQKQQLSPSRQPNQKYQHGHPHQHDQMIGASQFSFSSISQAESNSGHVMNGILRQKRAVEGQPDADFAYLPHWHSQIQLAIDSRNGINTPHRHCKKSEAVRLTTRPREDTAGDLHGEELPDEHSHTSTTERTGRRQDWNAIDFSGQGLRKITRTVFLQFNFLTALFLDHNELFDLDPCIAQLKTLEELDISDNHIRYVPPEVGMLVHLKNLLMFDNEITELPMELGHLFRLEMLGIEGNPLDPTLKEHLGHHGTKAMIRKMRDEHLSPNPPQPRPWISFARAEGGNSMSVMSYNILCDKYATTNQYGYTPARALAWENRQGLIMAEILESKADILCLQEIDRGSFLDIFQPQLATSDYKGIFYPKTRAKNMNEKESMLVDGCAIFYRSTKFACLDKMLIDLATTAINRPDMKSENDIFNRVMPRDNIALVALLEHIDSGQTFMIGNAHIFWDPAYADVKLVQVAILLEEIAKKSDEWAGKYKTAGSSRSSKHHLDHSSLSDSHPGRDIPLIICGDFNSAVGTGVYDLITRGDLPGTHADFESRAYGKFTREGMRHPFTLRSAYGEMGELQFTNYTPNFTGVLDYIWYSNTALKVTGLLGDVDQEYLRHVPGFPHVHFPSDHLALHATFDIRPQVVK